MRSAWMRSAWMRLPSALRHSSANLAGAAADLLFPWRCAGCGRAGSPLCDACAQRVPPMPATGCPRCGNPLETTRLCAVCAGLLDDPLTLARSAALYEGVVRRAIHNFKYNREPALGPLLARYLVAALADPIWQPPLARGLLVAPVPLHARREAQRGYNQAALLAGALAAATGLPVQNDLLTRSRETRPQVGLNAHERRQNVQDSFVADAAAHGRHLLLIDDVFTTGATLRDCARAALAAGALSVSALTVARPRQQG